MGQARPTPVIPVPWDRGRETVAKFETSFVYMVSSKQARATQWDHIIKKKKKSPAASDDLWELFYFPVTGFGGDDSRNELWTRPVGDH